MFEKPGPKKKSTKIMNRKSRLHDIKKPSDLSCKRCDIETGTERFSHYEGFRKHQFGKGTGVKCDDSMTAFLCQKCTDIMDKQPDRTILGYPEKSHSEEWLYLICKTHLL
jgi:hypothetical protein